MRRVLLALLLVTAASALLAPSASADFGYITSWGTRGPGDGQFELNTTGIAVDKNGDVLVNDNDNQRVERFDNKGNYLRQWATAANVGIGIAPDNSVYAGNRLPTGLEIDHYDTVGSFLGKFDDVPENLYDLTTDPSGNVYEFTGGNGPGTIVKKFNPAGTQVAQWGTYSNNPGDFTSAGGYGMGADAAGNLYVSDAGGRFVNKYDTNGNFLLKWGSEGSGPGQFGVIGPAGVGIAPDNTVWVADPANNRVQHFAPDGSFISAFGEAGTGPGQFDRPSDVAIDSAGNVFVMDAFHAQMQKWGERPTPVVGQSMAVQPVSGVVLVKLPGATKFVPLAADAALDTGTIVDARKGRVRIRAIVGGKEITGEFFEGQFQILQKKLGATADIKLFGASFKRCPKGRLRNPKSLGSKKPKSLRHLWGESAGAFRTVGRFSASTVRGTTWLTDDQCTGTLTKVTAGAVSVRDFVKKKTVLVSAGQQYFARGRR